MNIEDEIKNISDIDVVKLAETFRKIKKYTWGRLDDISYLNKPLLNTGYLYKYIKLSEMPRKKDGKPMIYVGSGAPSMSSIMEQMKEELKRYPTLDEFVEKVVEEYKKKPKYKEQIEYEMGTKNIKEAWGEDCEPALEQLTKVRAAQFYNSSCKEDGYILTIEKILYERNYGKRVKYYKTAKLDLKGLDIVIKVKNGYFLAIRYHAQRGRKAYTEKRALEKGINIDGILANFDKDKYYGSDDYFAMIAEEDIKCKVIKNGILSNKKITLVKWVENEIISRLKEEEIER